MISGTPTGKVKLNHTAVTLLHRLGKVSGKLTLTPASSKKATLTKALTFQVQEVGRQTQTGWLTARSTAARRSALDVLTDACT